MLATQCISLESDQTVLHAGLLVKMSGRDTDLLEDCFKHVHAERGRRRESTSHMYV